MFERIQLATKRYCVRSQDATRDPGTWFGRRAINKYITLLGYCHLSNEGCLADHDDVIKWKHFRRYWPFVRGIHRPTMNSPHKGQWRGDLMYSLICVWINAWVNNREAGDLRHHRAHYDVIVMPCPLSPRMHHNSHNPTAAREATVVH